MLNILGNLLKYSLFAILVLVLSNVIEVKGITVAQHFQRGIYWLSHQSEIYQGLEAAQKISHRLANDIRQNEKADRKLSGSLSSSTEHQTPNANYSLEEQQELKNVIQKSISHNKKH